LDPGLARFVATLLTTLPLLGVAFLLEGQADLLGGQRSRKST
jgi:hypothetical protein